MKKTLFLIPFLAILVFPVFAHADTVTFPDGCTATTKYSATTGQPCQKDACSPGDVYSSETGQKCSDINTNLPQGCTTLVGYSPLTGHKCDSTDLNIQTVSQANQGVPTVLPTNTTPDPLPTSTYKLSYPDSNSPYSLSKSNELFDLAIQVGSGASSGETVYITTPDGVKHLATAAGNKIQFKKFAFITTAWQPTQPGTYSARFEVPAYGIDQTIQFIIVD